MFMNSFLVFYNTVAVTKNAQRKERGSLDLVARFILSVECTKISYTIFKNKNINI